MQISDILTQQHTLSDCEASSKKRLLDDASQLLAKSTPGIDATPIFEGLLARERLGSTAVGHGVALPHCRIPNLTETLGCFLQLKEGINFDASDNLPVDLVFVLLVPEDATEEHLQILAELATLFRDDRFRTDLRKATDDQSLYETMIEHAG